MAGTTLKSSPEPDLAAVFQLLILKWIQAEIETTVHYFFIFLNLVVHETVLVSALFILAYVGKWFLFFHSESTAISVKVL